MGSSRHNSNPWLADHVIFFGYRWLSWTATAMLLLALGSLPEYAVLLVTASVLNLLLTLLAERYVRLARHNPVLLSLDILYAVLVLLARGGWNSPFIFYAYSSLVLPALLFGWRGGLMSGLSFAGVGAAALWAAGTGGGDQLLQGGLRAWAGLALVLAAPPIFGMLVPTAVEVLRRVAERSEQQARRRAPPFSDQITSNLRADPLGFALLVRDSEQGRARTAKEASLAAQATRIRAAEPSVEDLRRIVFAPLPAPEVELSAALEELVRRFRQHTGAAARVTLLGRTRLVHPMHRGILIRLAQEALLNIQQHAHASSAVLTLRYDAALIALLIQDDGVGLLDGTHERPGLHALRALRYRLAELDGRLDVFETEGGGVTVRATIPLE